MVKKSRLHARMPLSKFGFIQISGDEGGQILNISDAGLCFQSFAPLGNAKNLQFWFSLNLRDRIEANGQIAWLDPETKVGGIRFQNLTERAIKHIRTYATGGARKEVTCEKGSIFAAALAKHVPDSVSAKSNQPEMEASIPPKVGNADSLFYRPVDRSTQPRPEPLVPVDSTDLISLQRHLAVTRKRLLVGFVLGILAASSVGVMLVPYLVNRARTASPQSAVAVSSEKRTAVQPAPNVVAQANPEATKNSAGENSLRLAASHSYDAKLSRVNSAQSSSPFFSNNANDPVKTGSPRALSSGSQIASKVVKTPQQLWTAVQAGDSNAAIILADRYMRGDGVPANCVQARVLLLAASERNNAIAIKKLHELDKNGCS